MHYLLSPHPFDGVIRIEGILLHPCRSGSEEESVHGSGDGSDYREV